MIAATASHKHSQEKMMNHYLFNFITEIISSFQANKKKN